MSDIVALKIAEEDNVATLLYGFDKGASIVVKDAGGNEWRVESAHSIPTGHKVALKEITAGEHVVKYGAVIGVASQDICPGEHVHVHNLESTRGRGDLKRG